MFTVVFLVHVEITNQLGINLNHSFGEVRVNVGVVQKTHVDRSFADAATLLKSPAQLLVLGTSTQVNIAMPVNDNR